MHDSGFSSFRPARGIDSLLTQTRLLAINLVEQELARDNISYLQWPALISTQYGRGITCKALAREIAHDPGATTRLVDLLECRNLAVRRRDERDRRVVNLTENWKELSKRSLTRVAGLWDKMFNEWKASQVTQLIFYLQKLEKTLDNSHNNFK